VETLREVFAGAASPVPDLGSAASGAVSIDFSFGLARNFPYAPLGGVERYLLC